MALREPVGLECLVAGAERRDVVGVDADLGVVEAVRAVLDVARVDVDLDGILDPRVGAGVVENRVGDLGEHVQRVVLPERPNDGARPPVPSICLSVETLVAAAQAASVSPSMTGAVAASATSVNETGSTSVSVPVAPASFQPTVSAPSVTATSNASWSPMAAPVSGRWTTAFQPPGPVVDHARDVTRAIAPEDEGRIVDHERCGVGRLRGGVIDLDVRRQVVGLPAELEPDRVVAEPVERQLLPLERTRRGFVEGDVPWKTYAVRSRAGELAVDRPEVRRLGPEVAVEQERCACRTPAAAVMKAPHRHREEVVAVRPEDPEGVAVVVALVDQLGRVDRRAGRHVHLADGLGHRQVFERGDRLLERPDRRRQAEVELVADRVDRNAAIEQAGDEVVEPLALAGLLGVVVVDHQRDRVGGTVRGVRLVEGFVREGEGVVDVGLAEDVVPGAAAQAVGLGRAVGHSLVNDVEGDERIGAAPERPVQVAQRLGHVGDVVLQPGPQEGLVGVARCQRRRRRRAGRTRPASGCARRACGRRRVSRCPGRSP